MELRQIPNLNYNYPFLKSFYYEKLKLRKKVAIINRCRALNKFCEVIVDENKFDEYLNNERNINGLMEDIPREGVFFLFTRISPEIEQKHPELTTYFSGMIKAIKNSYPELQNEQWLNRLDSFPHLERVSI